MAKSDVQGAEPFSKRVTAAYATTGPAVQLGKGMLDEATDPAAVVQMPVAMLNRHGLIAGATGTGKTKTLQLLAEQLSALGVPVFAADVKGDLTRLAIPGPRTASASRRRVEALEMPSGRPWRSPCPSCRSAGSGPASRCGRRSRPSVRSSWPRCSARTRPSPSSLSLVFRYADDKGLALLDLDDLREVLSSSPPRTARSAQGHRRFVVGRPRGRPLREDHRARGPGRRCVLRRARARGRDLLRTTPEAVESSRASS